MDGGSLTTEGGFGLGLGQLSPPLLGPALRHPELRPGGPDRGPKNLGSLPPLAFAEKGPPTTWLLCDPGQCTPLSEPWFPLPSQGCRQSQQEEVESVVSM